MEANNSNSNAPNAELENVPVSSDLKCNIDKIKNIFVLPESKDIIIRYINIKSIKAEAALVFLHGIIDSELIQEHIIGPLIETEAVYQNNEDIGIYLMKNIITVKNLGRINKFKQITDDIINGYTLLFIEGYNEAISVSTTKFQNRAVEKPTVENTVRGPKEAFTESCAVNRSLIRKNLKNSKLVAESIILKGSVYNEVFIMYIKDIVNPELLQEVRERLSKINSGNIVSLSMIEQYIEDKSYSIVPTVLDTERPDRTVAFLEEGYVAMVMEGSPYSLIVPVTFWSFFHTPEDQYHRWPYGNFIRLLRMVSCYITLLTPGIYIAISSYHVDMIPTELVIAIAASRENLPFPSIIEVLIMEVAFDLIREAGTRVPIIMGSTIGIVGALVLGQAAVQANIVSPILVIIVSITGLASFTIPDSSLNFMLRIGRYIFLLGGSFMGFFGIGVCFAVCIAYLSTVKSFGVPFNSPMAPYYKSSKDTIVRPTVWKQWLRPMFVNPLQKVKSKKPKEE